MSTSKAAALQVQTERDDHHDVFISYRRGTCGNRNIDDLVSAVQLGLMLKAKGLTVFVDKSGISVGDTWRDKFMTELKFAQVVILVISRNTMVRYERPKPPDLASMISGMLASGVHALTEPLVSLAGGGSLSASSPPRSSLTGGTDNVLLEWMIAMSLKNQKIIIPVFIGDSDAATGIVGDFMDQGVQRNLLEPPSQVLDATRAYASAFLASQCDPPVLLAECCHSLSALIGERCGISSLNGVIVRSVAWDIVPEIIVSGVLHSPLLRELLAGLTPRKAAPGHSLDDSFSSAGSTPIAKDLSQSFNAAEQTDLSAESLYELCYLRTQLWPHAAPHCKAFRRRDSTGFSLFIAEPVQLRGTSVDLFPPFPFQTFYVFLTRGENPNCSEFVQTWKDDRCTLQLPYIHNSIATISCHHATLRYCGEQYERNGLGLADGHFDVANSNHPHSAGLKETPGFQSCPCGLPNPHGKTSSYSGTFALSFPHVGKDKVLLSKRVPTAADAYKLDNLEGGFASLDGNGPVRFMYFMLSNVVIGISDPVAPPPPREATTPTASSSCSSASPANVHQTPFFSRAPSITVPPPPASPNPLPFECSPCSPVRACSLPHMFNNKLSSSLRGGTVSDMEQGGWDKMSSCWSD